MADRPSFDACNNIYKLFLMRKGWEAIYLWMLGIAQSATTRLSSGGGKFDCIYIATKENMIARVWDIDFGGGLKRYFLV